MAMIFVLMAGLANAEGGKTYDVKVWVSAMLQELTAEQIERFNETNTEGITINATVEPVSEPDVTEALTEDMEAGADVYCFVQDQFAYLMNANALDPLGAEEAAAVKSENDAVSVSASTSGDTLYAYPFTSDNGYFMYYDKSVIPEGDTGSLEQIIADCEAAGKNVNFELATSGWYSAAFFFATGCVSEWTTNKDGEFISLNDTYDSPEGMIAAKGMKKLLDSSSHRDSSLAESFNEGGAVLVSGTWEYENVKSVLGDNMGVAELPSFEVDGKEYHLGSFNGNKLMGVKPQTDEEKAQALHLLAQYLTGEQAQMERFESVNWAPSNLKAQSSEAVSSNEVMAALIAQNEHATTQGQIHGSWWEIANELAAGIRDAKNESELQQALDLYKERLGEVLGQQGWLNNADGTWSYMDIFGHPVTGIQAIGNDKYCFDQDGVMQTGWQSSDGEWYYFNNNGAMAVGWVNEDGTWYYLNMDDGMVTGWKLIDGTWYYFTASGAMATGWQNAGGVWYYLDESGAMTTGWRNAGGVWYYMDESGAMATGWRNIGGTWYYFEDSGAMATGWQLIGGGWFYFAPDGSMTTGWLNKGGTWYWFDDNGAMATGWKEINGSWEMFADSGEWLYTWQGN